MGVTDGYGAAIFDDHEAAPEAREISLLAADCEHQLDQWQAQVSSLIERTGAPTDREVLTIIATEMQQLRQRVRATVDTAVESIEERGRRTEVARLLYQVDKQVRAANSSRSPRVLVPIHTWNPEAVDELVATYLQRSTVGGAQEPLAIEATWHAYCQEHGHTGHVPPRVLADIIAERRNFVRGHGSDDDEYIELIGCELCEQEDDWPEALRFGDDGSIVAHVTVTIPDERATHARELIGRLCALDADVLRTVAGDNTSIALVKRLKKPKKSKAGS